MLISRVQFVLIACSVFMSLLFQDQGWSNMDHSSHIPVPGKKKTRTSVDYRTPDVTLINQRGEEVNLKHLLNSDRLVVLDFIFTTCPTICPILSAGMSSFQDRMGAEIENIKMVSITIDPEYDTPDVLKEYAKRYEANKAWEFLTGNRADIDRVMKAFDAYVADKMNHSPLTFLHAPGGDHWIRINGLMSTSELIKEYRDLVKD